MLAIRQKFPQLMKWKFRTESLAPFAILLVFFWTLMVLAARFLCVAQEAWDREKLATGNGRVSGKTRACKRMSAIDACSQHLERLKEEIPAEAALDAVALPGAYTALRVYIWVLPVLGFIGTAMGLSASIGGFKRALRPEATLETLMTSLNHNVIPGLAASFYVTIIALLAAAIGHYCMTMVMAWDEKVLEDLDRDSLGKIASLSQQQSVIPAGNSAAQPLKEMNEALSQLMQTLQEFERWFKRK